MKRKEKTRQSRGKEALKKIVAIKASMNGGLSNQLQAFFPNIIPVSRPLVVNKLIGELG